MGKDRCAVGLLQALCSVLRLEDERCRAHNTGVFTFRGEPDKGLYVRVRAPRKTLKPIASPLDQDSAVLHHATRKHNALRREKLLGNLAAYGKPAGRIVAHGLHHRIARFSGVVHGEACQAIYIPTGETMDYVRWFRSRRLTAAPGDSWPGSQRFQTAMHAAVAERPSRTNENVTDFAGRSLPSHHPSGIYDAAADARANGNIHQILHILARAEHKFAPGARIRVIRDNTRQIVPLLQERNKRQVSPTDVDRRNRNAPVAINRAGNGDTNCARPLPRWASRSSTTAQMLSMIVSWESFTIGPRAVASMSPQSSTIPTATLVPPMSTPIPVMVTTLVKTPARGTRPYRQLSSA